jgi:uncharacterized protein involved in exopolysaccharide biosynthesis
MDETTRPRGETDKVNTNVPQNANCKFTRQDFDEESINLADYIRVISKHRQMIFKVCAITVVVTAVVSLFLPKSFSATASVVPPMDVLQRDSMFAGGLGAAKNPMLRQMMDITGVGDMYVGILQSRSVADALIERFDLAKVYHIPRYVSDIRKKLTERTSIEVSKKGIISVTVEDSDPCRAAALANSYVEELDRQNKRLFVGQATSKKVFLENRLKEIEKDLSGIDNLLSRDAKIKEMLFELLTREYEIAKIEEAKSMPTIQILDKADVPEKKCKPKRTRMVVLAGVTSLFVGIFAAFIREYFIREPLLGTKF